MCVGAVALFSSQMSGYRNERWRSAKVLWDWGVNLWDSVLLLTSEFLHTSASFFFIFVSRTKQYKVDFSSKWLLPLKFTEQAAAAAAVRAQIIADQLRIQKWLWPVQPVPPAAAGLSWILLIMGLWPDWLHLQLSAVWLQSVSPSTGKFSVKP